VLPQYAIFRAINPPVVGVRPSIRINIGDWLANFEPN